jgi:hypothetical protein
MMPMTRDMQTSRTSRYFAEASAKCKCAQGLGLPPTFADLEEAYTGASPNQESIHTP